MGNPRGDAWKKRVENTRGTEKEYQVCKKISNTEKWIGRTLSAIGMKPLGKVIGTMGGLTGVACEIDKQMDEDFAKQLAVVKRVGRFNHKSRDCLLYTSPSPRDRG